MDVSAVHELIGKIGGLNALLEFTIVDDDRIPPLTPITILQTIGAVVELPENKLELRKFKILINMLMGHTLI